ncbi:MAG: FAD-dependent oxidoreductase, partial [Telluria sp.]
MKIAVIGAGISGLSCAYRLVQGGAEVTLYEAGSYFGGHSNTVDVTLDGATYGVDTGFLVFNDRTYPNLIALFAELGVETAPTDMSFSVKLPLGEHAGARTLEWAGSNLDTVFAQRSNLLRPRFLRMVGDILRF